MSVVDVSHLNEGERLCWRLARAQVRLIEEMGGICNEHDEHSLAVLLVVTGHEDDLAMRHLAPPEAADPWLDRAKAVYAEEAARERS